MYVRLWSCSSVTCLVCLVMCVGFIYRILQMTPTPSFIPYPPFGSLLNFRIF